MTASGKTPIPQRKAQLERRLAELGARLEAIHANADLSANGLRQSHGVMVNYVYDLNEIEANHFALMELGQVAASKAVQQLAEEGQPKEAKKAEKVA